MARVANRLADPPKADDAERFAGELRAHEQLPIPPALEQTGVGGRDVAGHAQHQGDGMLGGRNGVAAGRVHHDDSQPGSGVFVDVVGADAGADDSAEPRVAFERLGGDFDAASDDRAVELVQRVAEVLALQPGADFIFDASSRVQQIEAVLRQRVENDDFCHDCALG